MELNMKKYITCITEEDIRFEIETVATELEEDNQVQFPDADARAEFLEDCAQGIMDKLDSYEHYTPEYASEVLDLAKVYGYLL